MSAVDRRDLAAGTGRLVTVASCGSVIYVLILRGMLKTVRAAAQTASMSHRIWVWAIFLSLVVGNIVAWALMVRVVSP